MTPHRTLLAWSVTLSILAGCSEQSGSKPAKPGSKDGAAEVSESGYKKRLVSELPAVSESLPPLDDGRIEIAGPESWNPLSRSSKYLTGFVEGKASELPRIVVTADEPPAPNLGDTTEENAKVLATLLDAQLRKDRAKRIPERCLPIVLGETTFIRHVRLASLGGDPAVIQSLQTIRGGRMYTVELICAINAADGREYVKSLKDKRDYGYAVAANLKFGESADPLAGVEAPPATDTPPPEGTPAVPAPTPDGTPPAATPPAATPPAATPPAATSPAEAPPSETLLPQP